MKNKKQNKTIEKLRFEFDYNCKSCQKLRRQLFQKGCKSIKIDNIEELKE